MSIRCYRRIRYPRNTTTPTAPEKNQALPSAKELLLPSDGLSFSPYLFGFQAGDGHISQCAIADAGDGLDILDLILPGRSLCRSRTVPVDGVDSVTFRVAIEPHTHGDSGIDHRTVDAISKLPLGFFTILFVNQRCSVCLGKRELFDRSIRTDLASMPPEGRLPQVFLHQQEAERSLMRLL